MSDTTSRTVGQSDAELIAAVRAGDNDAYATLFERHRSAALRLGRQLMPGSDAEDLVSEAFTKVFVQLQNGKGPDLAFRAYLLTAVRRLHIDRIRADQRVRTTDDESELDRHVEFFDLAALNFERGTAADAFTSLPERWQLVLWHLDVEGQKPSDVAPLLGMSANSVSALAYRAREGLRQAYLQHHLADAASGECRWTTERMGAHVRGGLSNREAAKVDEHLNGCRQCMGIYLELSEVNSNLAGILAPALLGTAAAGYLAGGSAIAAGTSTLAGLKGLLAKLFLAPVKRIASAQPAAAAVAAGAVVTVAATAVVAVAATVGLPGVGGLGFGSKPTAAKSPSSVAGPGTPGPAATPDQGSKSPEEDLSEGEDSDGSLDRSPAALPAAVIPASGEPVTRNDSPGEGSGAGSPGAGGGTPGGNPGGDPGGNPGGEPGNPPTEPTLDPTAFALGGTIAGTQVESTLFQRHISVPISYGAPKAAALKATTGKTGTDAAVPLTVTAAFASPVRFVGITGSNWTCNSAAGAVASTIDCTRTQADTNVPPLEFDAISQAADGAMGAAFTLKAGDNIAPPVTYTAEPWQFTPTDFNIQGTTISNEPGAEYNYQRKLTVPITTTAGMAPAAQNVRLTITFNTTSTSPRIPSSPTDQEVRFVRLENPGLWQCSSLPTPGSLMRWGSSIACTAAVTPGTEIDFAMHVASTGILPEGDVLLEANSDSDASNNTVHFRAPDWR